MNKERKILLISFIAGMLFAIAEFFFAIYSHSQSALMDAIYDASELVFIILLLFLTPLFQKPVCEKRPFGYFQMESIFLTIKGFILLMVPLSVSAQIIQSTFSGGNVVNNLEVSLFQLFLGVVSFIVYIIMKKLNNHLSSPTVTMELLGWKLDILYSIGISGAFFLSQFLAKTPLKIILPYFDSIVATILMLFMLPETITLLWKNLKEIFLFSPDEEIVTEVKTICSQTLSEFQFIPTFFDITKTGRKLWVAIYFHISEESLKIQTLSLATQKINQQLQTKFPDCTCELILVT